MNKNIEESVISKIRDRQDRGLSKYGVSMERKDLTRLAWLKHAQEEAMDLAVYLEKLIQEEQEVGIAYTPESLIEASQQVMRDRRERKEP